MSRIVIGWTDTYNNDLSIVPFTEDRKVALIERIRKRKYNFNFDDYQYLPYCSPVFDDNTVCILTKRQFDNVMDEAWKDMRVYQRLLPMDVIDIPVKDNVLYEKEKWVKVGE